MSRIDDIEWEQEYRERIQRDLARPLDHPLMRTNASTVQIVTALLAQRGDHTTTERSAA